MSHYLAGMKLDVSGLIDDWGKRTVVSRLSGTMTAAKKFSGTFVSVLSGTLWIQPVQDTQQGLFKRTEYGLNDETTHLAIARKTLALKAADRLAPSGESYLYDVLDLQEDPTHNTIQLRRVKRT
jgi:hypothetical protein